VAQASSEVEHARALAARSAPSPLDAAPRRTPAALLVACALAVTLHAFAVLGVLVVAVLPLVGRAAPPAAVTELVEIALEPAPPRPAAEPPAPEPVEPEPAPRPVKVARMAPREPELIPEAAPAAAQAAPVLAQAPEPEVVDFGDTLVQGTAATFAGGVTEAGGTARSAVRDARARAGGVEGGTGTDTRAIDRSRPPSLAGGAHWDCPFPEEADSEDIGDALVTLRVRVASDGEVEHVDVVKDPGDGFGREARRCALRKRWQPGRDRAGRALVMSALVNVRFYR